MAPYARSVLCHHVALWLGSKDFHTRLVRASYIATEPISENTDRLSIAIEVFDGLFGAKLSSQIQVELSRTK